MAEMSFVTDFGDQSVLLPLAAVMAVMFAVSGWWQGALGWAAAIAGTLTVLLLLKLGFMDCGHLLQDITLDSPSGHTGASAAIYGGLLGIMARARTGKRRFAVPAAIAIAGVLGLSRVALGAHSGAEVVLGGIVGVAGAVCAVALAGVPPAQLRWGRLALLALLVVVVFHRSRLPAEAAIRSLAMQLRPFLACR